MAVCCAARHLAWVAGLLLLAPRTSEALWLDSAWQVAEVGGEGVRGPSGPSTDRVSPAFPICYIHVGKCAGGTLRATFRNIHSLSNNKWKFVHVHTKSGTTAFGVNIRRKCWDKNIVLWVRDPVERLMASWRNEVDLHDGKRIKQFAARHPDLLAGASLSQLFDLNYVAGAIHKNWRSLEGNILHHFLRSFHHGDSGLSWYVGENATELNYIPNEKIFVGTTEHMQEDWERLLAKLQVPLRNDTSLVTSVHKTTKKEEPLSSDALWLLRLAAQPEYTVLEKLVSRGLLSADYLHSIIHKADFTMRIG